jgi:hypothetical protein
VSSAYLYCGIQRKGISARREELQMMRGRARHELRLPPYPLSHETERRQSNSRASSAGTMAFGSCPYEMDFVSRTVWAAGLRVAICLLSVASVPRAIEFDAGDSDRALKNRGGHYVKSKDVTSIEKRRKNRYFCATTSSPWLSSSCNSFSNC